MLLRMREIWIPNSTLALHPCNRWRHLLQFLSPIGMEQVPLESRSPTHISLIVIHSCLRSISGEYAWILVDNAVWVCGAGCGVCLRQANPVPLLDHALADNASHLPSRLPINSIMASVMPSMGQLKDHARVLTVPQPLASPAPPTSRASVAAKAVSDAHRDATPFDGFKCDSGVGFHVYCVVCMIWIDAVASLAHGNLGLSAGSTLFRSLRSAAR